MAAFTGVSQPDLEIELADMDDKDLWVSKVKSLTADLKDVVCQKAVLAHNHKWSEKNPRLKHGMPFPTLVLKRKSMHLDSC